MNLLRRYYEPGAVYGITSVTLDRRALFFDQLACRFLLVCIEYNKYIYSFRFYGFVIMPEHLHCIIQPAPGTTISEIMKHIKGDFARKFNIMRKSSGSLWQKSFFDEVIRGRRHLINMIEYMHNNPVRAGLVAVPEDYEFSSYHYYYGDLYKNLIDPI